MSIIVCGDLHGYNNLDVLRHDRLPLIPSYLIVAGDWGTIWNNSEHSIATEKRLLKWYNVQPYITLVVLGNHEGYERISRLPQVKKFGNMVYQASPSVFILQTGKIYLIDGKKIFVYGGALSIDKNSRIPGVSWWAEEIPSYSQFKEAMANLETNNELDYIITHTAPVSIVKQMLADYGLVYRQDLQDETTLQLEEIKNKVTFKSWYFGHFHMDWGDGKFNCLYKKVALLT